MTLTHAQAKSDPKTSTTVGEDDACGNTGENAADLLLPHRVRLEQRPFSQRAVYQTSHSGLLQDSVHGLLAAIGHVLPRVPRHAHIGTHDRAQGDASRVYCCGHFDWFHLMSRPTRWEIRR